MVVNASTAPCCVLLKASVNPGSRSTPFTGEIDVAFTELNAEPSFV